MVRITTLKQQNFYHSDPILICQFSKKLQSDPVLIRPKLASVLIQSDPVLIRAHLCRPDILIQTRFPHKNTFWISVSGWKLTIRPDIHPAKRIVIISGAQQRCAWTEFWIFWTQTPAASGRIGIQVFLTRTGPGLDLDFVICWRRMICVTELCL